MSTQSEIIKWLANGETGESSKAMAFCAMDVPSANKCHPLDPSDLNRCLKLVRAAPSIREHFPKIAEMSPVWEAFILNWEILEEMFIEECGWDWSKARSAPNTYARMREIRCQADPKYNDIVIGRRK